MRVVSPKLVPARFAFEAAESRQDGWGRFERLHPMGGKLLSRFRLEEGDRLFVSFEVAGEGFEDVPAKVERSAQDEDGYFLADLRLQDEVEARRLGAALRGIVAKSLYY